MPLPRLVVLEGPDAERQFLVPPTGGGIGRGAENAIQLSDLAVSRAHAHLRIEGDAVILVDAGGKSGTQVNGKPVTEKALAEGDLITVGKTRLAFIPADGGVAVIPTAAIPRLSLELPSRTLLAGGDDRPRRHLSSLARLGDGLRQTADRPALLRLVCEVTRDALKA